jgi:hypothetical protein
VLQAARGRRLNKGERRGVGRGNGRRDEGGQGMGGGGVQWVSVHGIEFVECRR